MMRPYALSGDDYTWKNALLWGNCRAHFNKAIASERLSDWVVHGAIALIELIPIIGQIIAIAEKFLYVPILQYVVDKYYRNPKSKYSRKYPTMEASCTMAIPNISGLTKSEESEFRKALFSKECDNDIFTRIMSAHRRGLSFQDREIVRVCEEGKKHVILQKGVRGCVAAAAAMVASDCIGKGIEARYMNIGHDQDVCNILREHKLEPVITERVAFGSLQAILEKGGPAYISVTTVGGHAIVVDKVLEEGVQLRDPYHGWQIVVTKDAFIKAVDSEEVKLIQAKKEKPGKRFVPQKGQVYTAGF